MSFQPKSIWLHRDAGCLTDGEMGYDGSSRMEPKRGQWFMEANNGQQILNNKKPAIEAANGRPVSGVSHMNVAPWDNTSGFHSVPAQCTDRLFGSEQMRSVIDRNIQPIGNMSMARKGFETQYGNTPSVGLSMSHTMEDPSSCLSFGGIRKVKVNQVRESDNVLSPSMVNSYHRAESVNNSISLGQSYNNGEVNNTSMASTYSKVDESFLAVDQNYNKGDGNFRSIGHNYSNGDNDVLSMGQPYAKGNRNFISIGQSYEKGDGSAMSSGTSYNKGHEDFMSIGTNYSKSSDGFIQMAHNMVSIGQSAKDESTTISFGSFHDEPEANTSSGIISSYDLLTGNQNSGQALEVSEQKNSAESNVDNTVVNSILTADYKPDNITKFKELKSVKKAPPNNFPANVKSLLSTGMFDGVPVKYVSWSRDKNLKGVIKGTGYLCSCAECNHAKSLNAYEFERHAGCKTKHPNNHIYFENGKTIYAVVQELKNTPQEMLFDAIQNVTGSPINQKNFRIWKASYQAATRELQRIYGKDEITLPS